MRRRWHPEAAGEPAAPRSRIRSAARMAHVFHQLMRAPEGKQLSDLSKDIGVSEVTTLRLLQTLVYEGIVRKDAERGRYRLSPLFWLTALAAFPDVTEAQRHLRILLAELAQRTGAHVLLGVPYVGLRATGLITATGPKEDGAAPALPVGNVPFHAIAAGKCYLASLGEEELLSWLQHPLPKLTPHTCTRPQALLQEVTRARELGYAVDREECVLGTWGLAVPVTDVSGAVTAGLQLCGPVSAMSVTTIKRWLSPLQQVAQSLCQVSSSLARLQ